LSAPSLLGGVAGLAGMAVSLARSVERPRRAWLSNPLSAPFLGLVSERRASVPGPRRGGLRRGECAPQPEAAVRVARVTRYRPKQTRWAPRCIPDEMFSELFAQLGSHRDRALVAFWVSTRREPASCWTQRLVTPTPVSSSCLHPVTIWAPSRLHGSPLSWTCWRRMVAGRYPDGSVGGVLWVWPRQIRRRGRASGKSCLTVIPRAGVRHSRSSVWMARKGLPRAFAEPIGRAGATPGLPGRAHVGVSLSSFLAMPGAVLGWSITSGRRDQDVSG
jgi:hypothetical protein